MAMIRSDRLMSNLRRRFGVAAPQLRVRTQWSWKVKGTIAAVLLGAFGWLYYSGFDAGRIVAGFNVGKIEEERNQMVSELATLREENAQLKKAQIDLANTTQMAQGAKDVLSKQLKDLQDENTRLKEETSFFENCLAKTQRARMGSRSSACKPNAKAQTNTVSAHSLYKAPPRTHSKARCTLPRNW
jgi:transposase-like protein